MAKGSTEILKSGVRVRSGKLPSGKPYETTRIKTPSSHYTASTVPLGKGKKLYSDISSSPSETVRSREFVKHGKLGKNTSYVSRQKLLDESRITSTTVSRRKTGKPTFEEWTKSTKSSPHEKVVSKRKVSGEYETPKGFRSQKVVKSDRAVSKMGRA